MYVYIFFSCVISLEDFLKILLMILLNRNDFKTDLFETLEGTTTSGQSEPGSNGKEWVHHTPQNFSCRPMRPGP